MGKREAEQCRKHLREAREAEAKGDTKKAADRKKRAHEDLGIKVGQVIVIREYKKLQDAEEEAGAFVELGYELDQQAGQGGHINVGRTTTAAVLTGGLSLLFGASRSKDKTVITYRLKQQSPVPATTPPVGSRFCNQCGAPANDNAKFCSICGVQLVDAAS